MSLRYPVDMIVISECFSSLTDPPSALWALRIWWRGAALFKHSGSDYPNSSELLLLHHHSALLCRQHGEELNYRLKPSVTSGEMWGDTNTPPVREDFLKDGCRCAAEQSDSSKITLISCVCDPHWYKRGGHNIRNTSWCDAIRAILSNSVPDRWFYISIMIYITAKHVFWLFNR